MRRRQILSMKTVMEPEEYEKVTEPDDKQLRRLYKLKFGHLPKGRMKRETMLDRLGQFSTLGA